MYFFRFLRAIMCNQYFVSFVVNYLNLQKSILILLEIMSQHTIQNQDFFKHIQTEVEIQSRLQIPPKVSQFQEVQCSQEDALTQCQSNQNISFRQKYQREIYGFISIIISVIIFLSYQSFKEHCPYQSQSTCLQKFIFPNLKKWVTKVILDCILGIIQVHFLFKGTTIRLIPFVGILEMIGLYFFSDQTISNTYYIGAINMIHIVVLTIFILIYFLVQSILFCLRSKKKYFFFFMLIVLVLALLFYVFVLNESCDYWQKGINGKIEKIDGLCNIKTPSICWYNVINGHFGLSWVFNNCYLGQEAKDKFNQVFSEARESGEFISFANPYYKFTQIQRCDQNIQKSVIKYAKGFTTLDEAKKSPQKPDIVFDSQKQIYHIEVQKNESLIKQRAEVWEKQQLSDSPPLVKNVLFLYVDSISRQSMHLKLPNLVKWFEKQAVNQSYFQAQNKPISKNPIKAQNMSIGEAYQFYRYNSLKAWTQPNEFTMFYGVNIEDDKQMQKINGKIQSSIPKYFKNKGYITGSANSFCQVISASIVGDITGIFQSSRFDHQSQSFACDPNFQDPQNLHSVMQGRSSSGKRCLYGKIISEYVCDYTFSFFEKYKDQPKFFSMHFQETHQGTGQGANPLNEPLSNLIQNLDSKGYLEDTIVMLISDHGLHMQGMLFAFGVQNFFTERNLPGLMVRLPQKMNKQYRNGIRKNQQSVITAKNIHHFLKHITEGDKYEGKKQSLLDDLTDNNSCDKVGINIPQFCSCK